MVDNDTNAAAKASDEEQNKADNSGVFAGEELEPENEEKRVPKLLIVQNPEDRELSYLSGLTLSEGIPEDLVADRYG